MIPPGALQHISGIAFLYPAIFERSHVKLHITDWAGQEVGQKKQQRENLVNCQNKTSLSELYQIKQMQKKKQLKWFSWQKHKKTTNQQNLRRCQ